MAGSSVQKVEPFAGSCNSLANLFVFPADTINVEARRSVKRKIPTLLNIFRKRATR